MDKTSTLFDLAKLQANHSNIFLDLLDQSIQNQLRILFHESPPFSNNLFRWSNDHNLWHWDPHWKYQHDKPVDSQGQNIGILFYNHFPYKLNLNDHWPLNHESEGRRWTRAHGRQAYLRLTFFTTIFSWNACTNDYSITVISRGTN